jgi:hypothetical protein
MRKNYDLYENAAALLGYGDLSGVVVDGSCLKVERKAGAVVVHSTNTHASARRRIILIPVK